jgi:dephospho-CoA kinase
MAPGEPVHDEVVRAFGSGIVGSEGAIDRAALGRIVFADPAQLERLEAIVHPAVVRRVERVLAEIAGEHRLPVIVVEAIKLIESGMYRRYDALWVTTASRATQLERLMARNRFSTEEALLRIDAQPPQSAKVALANEVIENDGSWSDLVERVSAAWERIPARFLDKCS